MPRAYVQPKAIIGSLQYSNPNVETIIANKTLLPLDSPLQSLDPSDNNYRVILPNPSYCNGLIFHIMNTSTGVGNLQIYENTNMVELTVINPNSMTQIICINGEWKYYTNGSADLSNYYTKSETDITILSANVNEIETINFNASMDAGAIENIIDNIPKYIHPGKTIQLIFSAGTYTFGKDIIELSNFYGGGKIKIIGDPETMPTKTTIFDKGMSDNPIIRFGYNKSISLEMDYIQISSPPGCAGVHINGNEGTSSIWINSCSFTGGDNQDSAIYVYSTSGHISLSFTNINSENYENILELIGNVYAYCYNVSDHVNAQPFADYLFCVKAGATIYHRSTTASSNIAQDNNLGGIIGLYTS